MPCKQNGGTMDYNSNPRHFTEVISSKMTIFKENKVNLLPCSLKTESVGLQRSYPVRVSAIAYGIYIYQRINQNSCDDESDNERHHQRYCGYVNTAKVKFLPITIVVQL